MSYLNATTTTTPITVKPNKQPTIKLTMSCNNLLYFRWVYIWKMDYSSYERRIRTIRNCTTAHGSRQSINIYFVDITFSLYCCLFQLNRMRIAIFQFFGRKCNDLIATHWRNETVFSLILHNPSCNPKNLFQYLKCIFDFALPLKNSNWFLRLFLWAERSFCRISPYIQSDIH